jgi:hypothetical protein
MQRVVILGRGGAGKSTVARRLGKVFGLPVIELDKHFWQPGLVPLPKDQWVKVQPLPQSLTWCTRADKPTALGDGWRPRSLRCPPGPSLCGRHGSVPRSAVVALSVADPPPGQRKVGLLVVADYLGMARTTENLWPARRAPNR